MQNKKLFFKICIALLAVYAYSAAKDYSMYFGNVNLTFNDRLGIYDLGHGHEKKENKDQLFTIGVEIGKNFALPANFRIALPLIVDVGSEKEDGRSVYIDGGDGVSTLVNAEANFLLINAGISPEVQYVLMDSDKIHPFLGCGGGIHYVKFEEYEWYENRRIIDPDLQSYSGLRWSLCGTIGAEFIINRHIGISVHYRFRYWYPVKGEYSEDLPYESADYKERFLSHQAGIGILIGK